MISIVAKNILLLYPFLYFSMNLRALLLIFLWGSSPLSYAQEQDTTYIQPYSQEIWLRAYTPTKMLILTQGKKVYSPNYPFSLGLGIGLRKILGLNVLYAQNLFRLKNKTNLKTRSIDIQAHKYGKRILIDCLLSGLYRILYR